MAERRNGGSWVSSISWTAQNFKNVLLAHSEHALPEYLLFYETGDLVITEKQIPFPAETTYYINGCF